MPNDKAHKQATPKQIAELRARLDKLEAIGGNAMVVRYRWYLSDRILHRFITARNGNVDLALEMLLNHLNWRADYGMDTILEEDMSHLGLDREFYWSGFDLGGRPCLVFRAAMHRKSDSAKDVTPEQKIRYYCQLLERGFRDYSPAFKFCLVLDCRNAGRENMDRKLMKIATPIIENNFPETQHATYVVPCGPVILMAWRFMSGFIDPGTAEKIKLLTSFDDPSLADSFSPETLEAFVTQDPSKASPQPYVEADPLGNAPTGSGASTAVSEQVDSSTLEGAPTVTSTLAGVTAANADHNAPFIASVGGQAPNPAPPSTAGFSMPPPSPEGSFEDMSPMGDSSFDRNPVVSGNVGVSPGGVSPCSPSGSFSIDEGHPTKGLGNGVARSVSSGLDGEATTAVPSAAGSISFAGSMSAMGSMSGRRVSAGNSQSFSNSPAEDVDRRGYRSGEQVMPAGQGLGEGAADRWGRGAALESTSAASSIANPAVVRGSRRLDRPPLAGLGADHGNVRGNGSLPSETSAVESGARTTSLKRGARSQRSGSGAREGSLLGEAEGMARKSSALGSDEVAEKTGHLYKRRDMLRGRFAYRRRYAVLRFPPGSTNGAATRDLTAPGGHHPHKTPAGTKADPPTLAVFKTSGDVKSEKVISLEGAEVKLGRSKAGDLYPFVVVFTNTQPQQQYNYVHEAWEPAAPSRRNTEDFTFPGSGIAPNVTSSLAGRSKLGSANGDLDGIDEDVDEEDDDEEDENDEYDPRASGRFVFPGRVFGSLRDVTGASNGGPVARRYPSFRQGQGVDSFSLSPSRSRSTTLPLPDVSSSVSSSMFAGSARGGGLPVRHSTTKRRTLHLACETEEETLEWVRRIDEAAVRYKVSAAASWARQAEGEVRPREGKTTSLPLRGSGGGGAQSLGTGADAAGVEVEDGSLVRETRHLSLGETGEASFENDASISYRYKYAQALAALAAATDDLASDGEDAEAGKKKRRSFNIMEAFRRGKTSGLLPDLGQENGKKSPRSNQPEEKDGPPQASRDSDRIGSHSENGDASRLPAIGLFRRNGSLRRLQAGLSAPATPAKSRGVGIRGRRNKRDSGGLGPIVGGDGRRRVGDLRDSLMSMRDLEISRLRRAYAKAELSRGEMKQCLRALALQLREGEDRTGALLADREALATEVNAKDAKLREKEAVLEERDSRASSEALAKEEMLANLKSENRALQAALERLRLDYREQRPGSRSRHGNGGYTNDGVVDGAGGVPGIVGGGGRNRRNMIGGPRGSNREGLLPPRPSSNQGSQIPIANRVSAAGNGCGASAAGVVATQCSLLGGGGGGNGASSGIRSEMTSCCSGSSAVQTCPSSSGIRLGNSPSESVRSAESTAVSSYSNCSVTVSIPSLAHGVCGVDNDAVGVGSDRGQGDDVDDDLGRPWIGDGSSIGAGEDWDEEEEGGGEAEGIEDDWQPWILNGDEDREVVVHRRPREVLSSLLKSLEDILSERDGSLGKRNLVDEEFFKNWERGTEELQGLRRPEEVDLMGEKAFTEGCLKLLTQHAAIVLGKDVHEALTEKEACRMAYAVGGDVYTIRRLEQHLAALVAGLPTE